MPDPIYVYVGSYGSESDAEADLAVVHEMYKDDTIRTYDAAVVVRDADGKVHVRHHEDHPRHAPWEGAAVGALVGILFPPGIIGGAVIGGAVGLIAHLWHSVSRDDLKELGEALDAGEANLVVISTSEFDHELAAELKADAHVLKKLDKAEAKAFERELKA